MAQLKLSKSTVDKLKPKSKDFIVWDISFPSFGIRVKPSGVKSYLVQYRNRETGQSRRKTLGQHGPLLSFNEAKERATLLLSEVLKGKDPVQEKRDRRIAPSITDLSKLYISEHAIPKKRPKSVREDQAMIHRLIIPVIGQIKLANISTQDIQKLHNNLKNTPYQANRVLSVLSKMFSLAKQWKLISENPVIGIEKFHEEKRYRWLSDDELFRLLAALDRHQNTTAADAIRLQLLTGARIGEILNAEWTHFDLQSGVWTKPSHHTKQKRTEHLPLSNSAIDLLENRKKTLWNNSEFVFSSRSSDGPIKDLKKFWKQVLISANIKDYRIHDNRHTHASHLVSSGVSLAIVGRLLGHTNPTTTARYAHLADQPLRDAVNLMSTKMNPRSSSGS